MLIKGASALETGHKVSAVIFDKTGTLTTGKATLSNFVVFNPSDSDGEAGDDADSAGGSAAAKRKHMTEAEFLSIVGSAEAGSEHPIARAVVAAVKARGVPIMEPKDFEAVPGRGLQCTVYSQQVFIGNREWMQEQGVDVDPGAEIQLQVYENEGNTAVCVAVDGRLVGVFTVSDPLKPEAAGTVAALRRMGVEVWMVTGDHERTAHVVAAKVGISESHVVARVLPAQKTRHVRKLQDKGHVVAMVGDGINDSPALTAAELGVAIGAGTEIAVAAADVVLVRSNLTDVVTALDLSRYVFKRILINMAWALAYNTLGIPLAAGILFPFFQIRLPPEVAALAMALSSVSVVTSSLLLRLYKKPVVAPPPHSPSLVSGSRSGGSGGKAGAAVLADHNCRCVVAKGYCDCEDCHCEQLPLASNMV